jgi:hypothetical protein
MLIGNRGAPILQDVYGWVFAGDYLLTGMASLPAPSGKAIVGQVSPGGNTERLSFCFLS